MKIGKLTYRYSIEQEISKFSVQFFGNDYDHCLSITDELMENIQWKRFLFTEFLSGQFPENILVPAETAAWFQRSLDAVEHVKRLGKVQWIKIVDDNIYTDNPVYLSEIMPFDLTLNKTSANMLPGVNIKTLMEVSQLKLTGEDWQPAEYLNGLVGSHPFSFNHFDDFSPRLMTWYNFEADVYVIRLVINQLTYSNYIVSASTTPMSISDEIAHNMQEENLLNTKLLFFLGSSVFMNWLIYAVNIALKYDITGGKQGITILPDGSIDAYPFDEGLANVGLLEKTDTGLVHKSSTPGSEPVLEFYKTFPFLDTRVPVEITRNVCSVISCWTWGRNNVTYNYYIQHLNDAHKWNHEQMAEWLNNLEQRGIIDQKAKTPEKIPERIS